MHNVFSIQRNNLRKVKVLFSDLSYFFNSFSRFFLTRLAYGLAQDNRVAVDKWDADYIILDKNADQKLNLSRFSPDVLDDVDADQKAAITQMQAILTIDGDEEDTQSITLFGIDYNSFLEPNLVEGEYPRSEYEVVADISLQEERGFQVGDTFDISISDKPITISGFTNNARYSVGPVIYMPLDDYHLLIKENDNQSDTINAVVVRGEVSHVPDKLEAVAINDFILSLPGYSAQNLTFGFMIGFLVLITAVVIGIFIYVLTMQKAAIFGVMKAQGISSAYIARSVIAQTAILAATGILLALVATLLGSMLLPDAVPFQNNALF